MQATFISLNIAQYTFQCNYNNISENFRCYFSWKTLTASLIIWLAPLRVVFVYGFCLIDNQKILLTTNIIYKHYATINKWSSAYVLPAVIYYLFLFIFCSTQEKRKRCYIETLINLLNPKDSPKKNVKRKNAHLNKINFDYHTISYTKLFYIVLYNSITNGTHKKIYNFNINYLINRSEPILNMKISLI